MPEHFTESAVSQNAIAGSAMSKQVAVSWRGSPGRETP